MKAARIHSFGPPDVVVVEDVPIPTPGPNEVTSERAELGDRWDVHVIFRVLSSLPDLKPTNTIVTRILATIPVARETPDRARGANGSTALCQS